MTRGSRSESSLFAPVARFLRRRGFSRLRGELQFFDYFIDVYGHARDADMTVAVELKLEKWQHAFEQAMRYQLCADVAYVGMPTEVAHRVDFALFRQYGIGLIGIDRRNSCCELLAPTSLGIVQPCYRDSYIDILGGLLGKNTADARSPARHSR